MSNIDLYKGDCLEVMDKLIANGVKVDAIITDPPYELENHGGTNKPMAKRARKVRDEIEFIANGFDYEPVFTKMLKLCKVPNLCIFCSNKQISKIMSWFENKGLSVTLLTWNKSNPSPLCNLKYISDLEFIIFVRGKGATWNNDAPLTVKYKCKQYPFVSPKQRVHPTEKPIPLIEELVQLHTIDGQTVLDMFMGSGTTGIACKNLNRNFIGIELDEHYFNIAKNRLNIE